MFVTSKAIVIVVLTFVSVVSFAGAQAQVFTIYPQTDWATTGYVTPSIRVSDTIVWSNRYPDVSHKAHGFAYFDADSAGMPAVIDSAAVYYNQFANVNGPITDLRWVGAIDPKNRTASDLYVDLVGGFDLGTEQGGNTGHRHPFPSVGSWPYSMSGYVLIGWLVQAQDTSSATIYIGKARGYTSTTNRPHLNVYYH